MRKPLLILCLASSCLGSVQLHAQICKTTSAYGLTGTGLIYRFNTSTGVVDSTLTTTAPTGTSGANAMGYNPTNGKFYFWAATYDSTEKCTGPKNNRTCVTTVTRPSFVSYTPGANTYQSLSVTNSPGDTTIRTGCVSADGTGYYCLDAVGVLWYYNILSNTWTAINSTWKDNTGFNLTDTVANQTSGDMAIDGYGNLWMLIAGNTQYGVYKVSAPLPTTPVASITLEQYVPYNTKNPDSKTIAGIAFDLTGNIYVSSLSDSLYKMDYNRKPVYTGTFTTTNVGNDLTSCHFPTTVLQPLIPLPVGFINFTGGVASTNNVFLNWVVDQNTNTQAYRVEHSMDNRRWETVGSVTSNQHTGSASYSYNHSSAVAGRHYYRIAKVDADGKILYSWIITVTLEAEVKAVIYPNPVNDVVNIQLKARNAETIAIKIADLQGREVYRQNTTSFTGTDIKVDASTWKPQFYIVTLYNSHNEVISTQKIIKY